MLITITVHNRFKEVATKIIFNRKKTQKPFSLAGDVTHPSPPIMQHVFRIIFGALSPKLENRPGQIIKKGHAYVISTQLTVNTAPENSPTSYFL